MEIARIVLKIESVVEIASMVVNKVTLTIVEIKMKMKLKLHQI